MFKPHVTVACVVHAEGKFLVVEETINGKALWNQPAGHLEADETLVEAAARELWEENHRRDAGSRDAGWSLYVMWRRSADARWRCPYRVRWAGGQYAVC